MLVPVTQWSFELLISNLYWNLLRATANVRVFYSINMDGTTYVFIHKPNTKDVIIYNTLTRKKYKTIGDVDEDVWLTNSIYSIKVYCNNEYVVLESDYTVVRNFDEVEGVVEKMHACPSSAYTVACLSNVLAKDVDFYILNKSTKKTKSYWYTEIRGYKHLIINPEKIKCEHKTHHICSLFVKNDDTIQFNVRSFKPLMCVLCEIIKWIDTRQLIMFDYKLSSILRLTINDGNVG